MSILVILPVIIPLSAAALSLVAWRSITWQRLLGVAGTTLLLGAGVALLAAVWRHGIVTCQLGGWPAPFGITLAADMFSAIMVVLTGLTGFAVAIYSLGTIDEERERLGYYPLLLVLLMGVSGAFVTGDVFNLYVSFEILLLASFVLLSLGGDRAQIVGSVRYVILNIISSVFFLMGAGLMYGLARTLNMADLAVKLPTLATSHPVAITVVGSFFLASFGIKAGVFPLYFWLPASYHTPPMAISALFAGLLTKVGVYALIRVFTLVLPASASRPELILFLAGATMALGVLGAVAQFDIRRILSFHILSQIGYMVMAFGLLIAPDPMVRRLALAAAVLYITHHIIVKTNLFLIGGLIAERGGSAHLSRLGGLAGSTPWLAILFMIPALSLAGVPPLSGFWAKLAVIQAGLAAERTVVVVVAVAAGLLTLLSMLKIWFEAFWKPAPASERSVEIAGQRPRLRVAAIAPVVLLAACTLAIGLYPEPFMMAAERAAAQLLDPGGYAAAVLQAPEHAASVEGGLP